MNANEDYGYEDEGYDPYDRPYDEARGPADPKSRTRRYQRAVWTEETTSSANQGRSEMMDQPQAPQGPRSHVGHKPNMANHPNRRVDRQSFGL